MICYAMPPARLRTSRARRPVPSCWTSCWRGCRARAQSPRRIAQHRTDAPLATDKRHDAALYAMLDHLDEVLQRLGAYTRCGVPPPRQAPALPPRRSRLT